MSHQDIYNERVNIIALITTFLFYFQCHAIDFEDAIFPELATSSRALAMGNAFISKVDDSSSTYYNPAGLGTVRHAHLHLSNFQLEGNKGWLASTKGKGSDFFTKLTNALSLDGTRQLLLENKGKVSHARYHMLPNFTSRYFSAGYLYAYQQRATIGNATGAKFEYAQRRDHGPYGALNISLFGGVLKFGVSATYLNRKEIVSESDQATTLELTDADYKFGSALILNSGVKFTMPITFLPTFSVVSHNTAQNKFGSPRGAGVPDGIRNTIDAGFSLTPQISQVMRIHLEANLKDITGQYPDVTFTRRLLMGMEIDFYRVFFFRFGYGDGFGSAGIGVKSQKLEFDLSTYAVDTSSSSFRGAEDRRFVIGFSTGI